MLVYHIEMTLLRFRYAEIQDKSSDISIPLDESNADPVSNKENEVENNATADAENDEDDDSVDEEELDAEEAEQASIEPHIEIIISDDEELS